MSNKKVELEGIGEIELVKSKRAKSLRISVHPFSGVKVSVPYFMPYKRAMGFVMEKKSWIQSTLNKMSDKMEGLTIFNLDTEFKTNLHQFVIIKSGEIDSPVSKISSDKIEIKFPLDIDILKNENQNFIRKSIEESWRIEAKMVLPRKTEFFAEEFGFKFNKVAIRNTKSRWGSCSGENNISLSLHLMRLPEELIDYVVLHELAHTKEKNHQTSFWKLLDSVTQGKAKELDKKMKGYSTRIY